LDLAGRRAVSLKVRIARAFPRLYQRYHRAFARFEYSTIGHFINEYSRRRKDIFFIQVGANDGITWDPYHFFIVRDGWKGIVIEPQSEVFEQRLKRTYAGAQGIELLNVAVDAQDGARPLYKYAFTTSRWATGLASFDRENLISNFETDYVQDNIRQEGLSVSRDPSEYLTTELVRCMSFSTILDQRADRTIDFLITDAERFDIPILNTFPLDRTRPRNIIFELPPTPLDQYFTDFIIKLRRYGYRVLLEGSDCIAVLSPEAAASPA
jgi:FkbM family methyltransferase